jgi:hypothetical protein
MQPHGFFIYIMDKLKRCNHCKRELPADVYHFYHNKLKVDGFDPTCKECRGYKFQPVPKHGYKICINCGEEHPETTGWFYFRTDTNKFKNTCIQCFHKHGRRTYNNDKEKAIEYQKNYREEHREGINERQRIYYHKNAHIIRPKENKKRRENPEYSRQYYKNVERFNLQSKLANNIRRRTNAVLHGAVKYSHALELLGCSVDYLWQHLESQFTEGMTRENYGKGKDKWNVDHIIPPPYFNLFDPEQQKKCFHYSNLRPMWGGLNIAKSSWYNGVKYYYKKPISK